MVFATETQISGKWIFRSRARSRFGFYGSTKREMQPDFSPDGTKLAFISYRSGDGEVWTSDVDGSNANQVTHGGARPAVARWSPDGRKMAFAKRPEGNTDVYVVDAQGGAPKRLTTDPANDGSAVLVTRWKVDLLRIQPHWPSEVWKIAADGSAPEIQVTKSGGWRSRESDDRPYALLPKIRSCREFFGCPSPADRNKRLPILLSGGNWESNGRDMYYLASGQALHHIDVASDRD